MTRMGPDSRHRGHCTTIFLRLSTWLAKFTTHCAHTHRCPHLSNKIVGGAVKQTEHTGAAGGGRGRCLQCDSLHGAHNGHDSCRLGLYFILR